MEAFDNEVSAQELLNYVIINRVNAAELSQQESERIMNEIKLHKKQSQIKAFVAHYHVTKDGSPRAITPPKKEGGLWYTRDPFNDGKKIRARDEAALYQKLYELYSSRQRNLYSVRTWYDIGVQHRKNISNPQPSTIERHERTKKSYFTEELLDYDVRDITSSYLWGFMREAQATHQMSLSETKQLKGTLNLVFEAASDPEIGCRTNNPMSTVNPAGLFKNNAAALKKEVSNKASAFSDKQVDDLRAILRGRIETYRTTCYSRCKYALMGLLASHTGMRASELPALMWDDIKENYIHLHQMQIRHDGKHGNDRFEVVPWLKEEKGQPRGGRIIPFLNTSIPELLTEIKKIQEGFGIESEWVFPDTDSISYEKSLYKVCKRLGYEITNNHAFRKGFNMWMLSIGLNVADRAKILGHSTAVNLDRYTVVSDNWIENVITKVTINKSFETVTQNPKN